MLLGQLFNLAMKLKVLTYIAWIESAFLGAPAHG